MKELANVFLGHNTRKYLQWSLCSRLCSLSEQESPQAIRRRMRTNRECTQSKTSAGIKTAGSHRPCS